MEIGSEFWIEPFVNEKNKTPGYFQRYGEVVFTSSGRSAYSLMLKNLKVDIKKVLLPKFICESVVSVFQENGYECIFYELDSNLCPFLESFKLNEPFSIFVHLGYFGFRTNNNLNIIIKEYKENSVFIVEDVTHNLFSSMTDIKSDFYIGSIRKWFGLPSGGFLASSHLSIDEQLPTHTKVVNLRKKALNDKYRYIIEGKLSAKPEYLQAFKEAEEILDSDYNPYFIDDLSKGMVFNYNYEEMISIRRRNFDFLLTNFKASELIQPLFTDIENEVCPLFFPVKIAKGRDKIRQILIENEVYCPIHWPKPNIIEISKAELNLYEKFLSIPCDQRYNFEDMKRILDILNELAKGERI